MGICFSRNPIQQKYINKHDDYSKLNYFTFNNCKTLAKVVDVYDGDTCTIVFFLNKQIIKYKCRMLGYDSPEMKPLKTIENRNEIIEKAKNARDFFISLLKESDFIVDIKMGKFDKYGRILATMSNKMGNINELIIQNGHGVPYDGGTKLK
jgi:endonuclease YncB( thermonuclease family)